MTRVAQGWIPAPVAAVHDVLDPECDGGAEDDSRGSGDDTGSRCLAQPLHSQQAVDAEANKWATVWRVGSHAHCPIWPETLGEGCHRFAYTRW